MFFFCACLEILICIRFQGPAVVSYPQPIGNLEESEPAGFSAERAIAVHKRLFPDRPHPFGSLENAVVRTGIVSLLEEQGWKVQSAVPGSAVSGNIVAHRSEQESLTTTPLVLASHYDSCPAGPGAGDAGSCVAAVIEAARLLTIKSETLRKPVWLLFTDGEEAGLLGAREFVKSHPLSRQLPIVLNFDARGTAGPVLMFETHNGNSQAISRLGNRLVRPRLTGSLFTTIYRYLPNGTDFTEFRDAGWRGFNFAIIDGAHRYHQSDDTLENLDRRSVQHLGETVLSVASAIAETDDDFSDQSEDAIFFDVLGLFVIHIPISWNRVIRFVLFFVSVQIYGRRLLRDRAGWSVVRVWLSMAVMLPLVSMLGWLVSQSIFGSMLLPRPFVAYGHWISLAMWGICLAVCCLVWHVTLRGIDQQTAWRSFWLAHAATCMVVSIYIPEFSHLLFIPGILAVFATLTIRNILLRTGIVTCLSALLLIPLDHLIAIALGPANGMLMFPVFALLAMPLLPAFALAPENNRIFPG